MEATSSKKVILKSSDKEELNIYEKVVHVIEDDNYTSIIPLLNVVTSMILSNVIEYCKKHVYSATDDDEDEGVKVEQDDTIFDLMLVAGYQESVGLDLPNCRRFDQ
ncbi:hypothetical protein SOVF_101470, partial [Spinacia oleracea]